MNPIQTIACALAVIAGIGFSLPVKAATVEAATQYIDQVANKALGVVADKKLSKQQKQTQLEKLFTQNVDFDWVARFVMGRFWRQATDAQKARYLHEYQRFEILHYTSRFTDYTSGAFKITGANDDGDGEYTVSMQIMPGEKQSEPVLVDYRVRKQENGFKIFDVIIEGVSMISTQRSEFGSVVANNGIDYLIDQLAAKARSGDPKDAKLGN
jgi:phospholipid transport system substrate-binding protein